MSEINDMKIEYDDIKSIADNGDVKCVVSQSDIVRVAWKTNGITCSGQFDSYCSGIYSISVDDEILLGFLRDQAVLHKTNTVPACEVTMP